MGYLIAPVDRLIDLLLRLRNRHVFMLDVVAFLIAPLPALMLRTDDWASLFVYESSVRHVLLVFVPVKLLIFFLLGLYHRYWRYASIDELSRITLAVLAATVLQVLVFFNLLRPEGWVEASFPRSVPLIDGLLSLLFAGGIRYSVRLAHRLRQHRQRNGEERRVLVVGAGEAGVMIVEEMRNNPQLGLYPVAFVDDNPHKHRMRIRGLEVAGGRDRIPAVVRELEIDLIVIAIPTAAGKAVRDIATICKQTGVKTKIIPGVYELLGGRASVSQLRDVQVEDLLRRPPVRTNMARVAALVRGSRVLVTGAGGSIGAELCRQILPLEPAELVLLGHGENSIFRIEGELRRRLQNGKAGSPVRLHAVIADVRDRSRLDHVFGLYQPEIVFHAAAHKHVPLMERNIEEAVTNNVCGTQNLLNLAAEHGTDRFIFISTDKAVNPSSIMGATKRIAEMLVHEAAEVTGRAFVSVRFGNVLGSRGSVLEVWRSQIAQGGPLTVTHPDICRYFMTIPEAVHLVLQAAALGSGGEIFLLDMGEPVRILDLARDLIRLSGMEEGRDIDIVFTGLRPGEKLHEELSATGETLGATEHEKVLACRRNGVHEHAAENDGRTPALSEQLAPLYEAARQGDTTRIIHLIAGLVPEFQEEKKQHLLERITESARTGI